jgi:S1-C subfamily serine protease
MASPTTAVPLRARGPALLAAIALAAGACGGNVAPTPVPETPVAVVPSAGGSAGPSGSATTGSGEPSLGPSPSGEDAARVIHARLSPAVVFVRTPTGAGSGFAIDQQHVVTDAHVVRPYSEASITLADGRTLDGAKVMGSDLEADLAVLELPTSVAFPDATAGDPAALTTQERVFLVGYPTADLEQPASTITEAVVAGEPLEWRDELTYRTIDASVDDGQSGGVLADAEGRVLGVTNASRDEHPVALAIDDALQRVAAILGGQDLDGITDRLPEPGAADAPTNATATIRNRADAKVWVVTGAQGDDPGRITTTADGPALLYAMAAGGQLFDSAGPAGRQQTVAIDFQPPGPYLAKVETTGADAVTVALDSTLGLTPLDDPDDGAPIAIGEPHDGLADYAGDLDWYLLHLDAAQRVVIRSSSSSLDTALFVDDVVTDRTLAQGTDSGGPLGVDDEVTFQAPAGGDYRIVVDTGSIGFGAYRLEVDGAEI